MIDSLRLEKKEEDARYLQKEENKEGQIGETILSISSTKANRQLFQFSRMRRLSKLKPSSQTNDDQWPTEVCSPRGKQQNLRFWDSKDSKGFWEILGIPRDSVGFQRFYGILWDSKAVESAVSPLRCSLLRHRCEIASVEMSCDCDLKWKGRYQWRYLCYQKKEKTQQLMICGSYL